MMDHQPPHLSRIARLRRWLQQLAAIGGLLLAVALVAILGFLALPLRLGQPVDGVIVNFIWYGKGSSLAALVRLPDGEFMVPVRQSDDCRLGGRIHLNTTETRLGRRYGAALMPCSATNE